LPTNAVSPIQTNTDANVTVLDGTATAGSSSDFVGTKAGDFNTLATGVNLNLLAPGAAPGADSIQRPGGVYAILVEGTTSNLILANGLAVDAPTFASMLVNSPSSNYTVGTPILIVGCNAGGPVSGGINFAQALANILNAPIVAASSNVWVSNRDASIVNSSLTTGPAGTLTVAPIQSQNGVPITDSSGYSQPNMGQQGKFNVFYPKGP
jgi:hypothetical protein